MGRIVPVYEAIKGCSSRVLRRILHNLLEQLPPIPEALPEEVVLRLNLLDLRSAVQEAHFPPASVTMEELASARSSALKRLIFEELFFLEVEWPSNGSSCGRRRVFRFKRAQTFEKR
jgi:ATP-dependent DNA helicase RecG